MDAVFMQGIVLIQYLQSSLKNYEDLLILISKLGDPSAAFFIYFPLMFVAKPLVGVKVIWTAAVSELANCLLKWILYGPRPYWWVHSSGVYGENPPSLEQYYITCETGPGSPSGHCMVTGAVLYVMCAYVIDSCSDKFRCLSKILAWICYFIFMIGICISRCFVATHFPHQVFAGIISGFIIGWYMNRKISAIPSIQSHFFASIGILVLGFGLYGFLETLGHDTLWSVKLAETWCKKQEWISLDTTLFYSIIKDSASIFGLCVSFLFYPSQVMNKMNLGRTLKIILGLNVLYTTYLLKHFKSHSAVPVRFYALSYVHISFTIFTVIVIHKLYCKMF